jgi:FkbM family methyltransferase
VTAVADLRCLGEHTIDIDLLPEEPLVLDVGCRGFAFDREILALRPKARIIALDPDPEIEHPLEKEIIFMHKALTEKVVDRVVWQGPGDGAYIVGNGDPHDSGYRWPINPNQIHAEVQNTTMYRLLAEYGPHFDVVKLDCEGSEFGILEAWPGPFVKQISVEFHDFVDRRRWNGDYFENLFAGPLHDYNVVLFGLTPMGPGNHMGHWDSLLVLK